MAKVNLANVREHHTLVFANGWKGPLWPCLFAGINNPEMADPDSAYPWHLHEFVSYLGENDIKVTPTSTVCYSTSGECFGKPELDIVDVLDNGVSILTEEGSEFVDMIVQDIEMGNMYESFCVGRNKLRIRLEDGTRLICMSESEYLRLKAGAK
jgi:hypothetical protein